MLVVASRNAGKAPLGRPGKRTDRRERCRGRLLLSQREKTTAAESRLQEATELQPNSAAAWVVGLAQTQEELGKNDAARSSYEQYLELNPEQPGAEKAKKALASLQQPRP